MSYPNKVVERATKVANLLKENGFFEDEELNPEIAYKITIDKFSELFYPKWVSGDDEDFSYSDGEFEKVLTEIILDSVLESLKQKGIIDSIDDKHFLTEKGKEILH
jgi:hypothetical protein